ncbi:MMAD-like protein [Mya arenaria]|uniref:MMAD-like protein n=1 Tax=Mya arenaria TaxID=6604 RepID=A0ABY7DCW7_MYAAR|nr:MMAD-like protein [Mya arenaria]
MASRILYHRATGTSRMYLPNLNAAVQHFRAFSWHRDGESTDMYYKVIGDNDTDSFTVWPDKKLGPFGPKDRRFPFPGNVGLTLKDQEPLKFQPVSGSINPEAIFDHIPAERHSKVLQHANEEMEALEELMHDEEGKTLPSPDDLLECVAHDCPTIMRKDFADLFPNMNIMMGHFTIITISQKTKSDMSGWSEEVEDERETLLQSFVQGATDICEALQSAGYWADFVDPSCGKPTDERYRKLGFEIDDLGCCKVIRHHVWGTHSYIGCLFTNAPASHPILQLMKKHS